MNNRACVFCDIISGDLEAGIVYEDDRVIAIVDQRQANPGHVLVIPREHTPDIFSLSEDNGSAIMRCMIRISKAVQQAFEMEGLSIWQSNGPAAHQEVPHVHFHIHPRQMDDGILKVYPSKPHLPDFNTQQEYADRIKRYLLET